MEWNARLLKNSISDLTNFLAPLVATLGRSERRRAAVNYVEGLLLPGQRKSIEPLAARLGVDAQGLQQLLTSSPWSEEALWKAIRHEVIPHLEPLDHFEGRSWRGFHHHLVLSAVAYLFILVQYNRTQKNFWCDVGADPASDPTLVSEGERLLQLLRNEI